MRRHFNCIGIVGYIDFHKSPPNLVSTYKMLWAWLTEKGYNVIVENKIAQAIELNNMKIDITLPEIGHEADLAIVVGGDGNMLGAARILSKYDIKVIGINRGNLGFLTDLDPNNAQFQLDQVLQGKYITENRFLLESEIKRKSYHKYVGLAMNEIVLHSGIIAHMIEFEVYIDDIFAFSQRSDGLIISTPTGSTAYSLSAGGPILTPSLDAISLVPMFPHTLSIRPLVINSNSIIRLRCRCNNRHNNIKISLDSQIVLSIKEGEDIIIRRSQNNLSLIHPNNYCYFNTLNSKLGWAKKFF
ncbi:NAD(+) kinase [Candidatus Pantoea edessiphila]|uniref:NAD kinase n=1 Tax=Candidatus Pantoea edessiphila TaxID=2044610 RepID=A0A2P5SWG0_9GAMM|nr:NAD(+) kinase [Candidatus Pantoea edessiphila]PPI86662.1 NAD(+) kinase [Candidatus Pantoea edessiphila]